MRSPAARVHPSEPRSCILDQGENGVHIAQFIKFVRPQARDFALGKNHDGGFSLESGPARGGRFIFLLGRGRHAHRTLISGNQGTLSARTAQPHCNLRQLPAPLPGQCFLHRGKGECTSVPRLLFSNLRWSAGRKGKGDNRAPAEMMLTPQFLEPGRIGGCVLDGVLNVAMAEVILNARLLMFP